jgi:hypothetical protein
MADVGDHLVMHEGRELGRARGPAGRVETASFAGEGEQEFGGAVGTADASEASLEDAAVALPRDHPVEEAAPEAVAAREEALKQGLEQRVARSRER